MTKREIMNTVEDVKENSGARFVCSLNCQSNVLFDCSVFDSEQEIFDFIISEVPKGKGRKYPLLHKLFVCYDLVRYDH